jgi:anti-sigma B factor antagonist
MGIKIESMKSCELLTLSGQFDSVSAPDLEESLLDLIKAGKRNLVLNMKDVNFVSSAGMGVLMSAQIKVRRRIPRGRIVFSEVPDALRDTFELVGMHHLFQFYDRDVEAVGSF